MRQQGVIVQGCFFVVNMLHCICMPAVECHHILHNSVSLASESYSASWDVLSVGYISVRLETNAPSPFEVGGQWEQDEVPQQSSCLIQFPEMTKGNMPSDTFHSQWSQPPRPGRLPVRTWAGQSFRMCLGWSWMSSFWCLSEMRCSNSCAFLSCCRTGVGFMFWFILIC